jgi:hypothetical protein
VISPFRIAATAAVAESVVRSSLGLADDCGVSRQATAVAATTEVARPYARSRNARRLSAVASMGILQIPGIVTDFGLVIDRSSLMTRMADLGQLPN